MSFMNILNNFFSNNRNNNTINNQNTNNSSLDEDQLLINDQDRQFLNEEKKKLKDFQNKFDNFNSSEFLNHQNEIYLFENSYLLQKSQLNEEIYYDPNNCFLQEYKIFLNHKKNCINLFKKKIIELRFHQDLNNFELENNLNNDSFTNFDSNLECPICLDNFSNCKKKITILNCNHIYHRECLFNWYLKRKTNHICIYNCNLIYKPENNYLLET